MKPHIQFALDKLYHGCERAEGLCSIFEYMRSSAPSALDCSDILRSALMLAVSAFDLFMHEIYRLEVIERLNAGLSIGGLKVPFGALVANEAERIEIVDQAVKLENSYKSFVAPDKMAECLRLLIQSPWDAVASEFSSSPASLKAILKGIVDLRNRIAHEADVNPAYAGIELWPIYKEDVMASIKFLRKLGECVASVVNKAS